MTLRQTLIALTPLALLALLTTPLWLLNPTPTTQPPTTITNYARYLNGKPTNTNPENLYNQLGKHTSNTGQAYVTETDTDTNTCWALRVNPPDSKPITVPQIWCQKDQ